MESPCPHLRPRGGASVLDPARPLGTFGVRVGMLPAAGGCSQDQEPIQATQPIRVISAANKSQQGDEPLL